jgi:hypothetical protein
MTCVKPYCFPETDGDILVLAEMSGMRENNISQLIKFRTHCNLGRGARGQRGQDTAVFKRSGSLPWRFTPMRMQSKHSYRAWDGGVATSNIHLHRNFVSGFETNVFYASLLELLCWHMVNIFLLI